MDSKSMIQYLSSIYLCGVSGAGKTSFIKNYKYKKVKLTKLFHDLIENPEFLSDNSTDTFVLFLLFSVYQNCKLSTHLCNGDVCIIDRTPFTSVWYTIIFECIKDLNCEEQFNKMDIDKIDILLITKMNKLFTPKGKTEITKIQKEIQVIMEKFNLFILNIEFSNILEFAKNQTQRNNPIDHIIAKKVSYDNNINFNYNYLIIQHRFFYLLDNNYNTPFQYIYIKSYKDLEEKLTQKLDTLLDELLFKKESLDMDNFIKALDYRKKKASNYRKKKINKKQVNYMI